MERMDTLLSNIATAKRAELIAMQGPETDPSIRYDRAEISPGCRIKPLDDVLLWGDVVARVICPADSPGWFYGLTIDGLTIVTSTFEATTVEDRAPVDPNEEPMPIFPEPPPVEP